MKRTALFIKNIGNYYSLAFFLVLVVYIVSGKMGLQLAFANSSISPVWPPAGIALAAILLLGYRISPAILIGAFIVNFTTTGTAVSSVGIAVGNTLEALIGAYMVRRFANGVDVFERVQDIFKLTILAGLFSTMISATIGVSSLLFTGNAQWAHIDDLWITWWLGDASGIIIVAPFVLLWASKRKLNINPVYILEIFLFLLLIIIVGNIIFSGLLPFQYLIISVLVWGAFRFGQREQVTAILILTIIAVSYALQGKGPYDITGQAENTSLLFLQMFLGTTAATSLMLTAALLERRKASKTIESNAIRFQALIENSFDAVVLIDPTSRIIYASPSAERILDYSPRELVGKTGFDLVVSEDRPMVMKELEKLILRPGGTTSLEYQTIKKDKKRIWVEATGTNLLLEPSVAAVVVNFRDITQEKIIQETLAEEKVEDDALLASIGEGLIATNDKGEITLVNDAACKMLRCTKEDLLDKLITSAIPMEDEEGESIRALDRPMTKVLTTGKPLATSPSNYYVRFDKTRFPAMFTLTPVVLDGKIIGTVEVFRDITEERAIDKAKTEFVSLASHQLRTPLTTINWYSERLVGKKLGELTLDQKRYVEAIYSAGKRMVDLINALLNISRLELGTFAVEPEEILIPKIAKEALKDLIFTITEKKLIVTEKYEDNFPVVKADPKLVEIIFQNLLSNAVKYTPENGKITIHVTYDKKDAIIKVSDTGYGIPQSQQPKIFSKLFRADNIRTIDTEGTGLGLYIIKLMLDKTGGKISFTSEENKGSVFTVSLPLTGMKPRKGKKYLG